MANDLPKLDKFKYDKEIYYLVKGMQSIIGNLREIRLQLDDENHELRNQLAAMEQDLVEQPGSITYEQRPT